MVEVNSDELTSEIVFLTILGNNDEDNKNILDKDVLDYIKKNKVVVL